MPEDRGSSYPLKRLPYIAGIQPPEFSPAHAVGFSDSSITAQQAAVNANGRTAQILIDDLVVQIISDTYNGQATIELLGGGPCWIGFSDQVTPDTGYQILVAKTFTMRTIIPVWAIGLQQLYIPPTLIQVSLVEVASN